MARKRLSGPQPDYLMPGDPAQAPVPSMRGPLPHHAATTRAPIAQVAAETAALAALETVSAELQAAQAEGRMVLSLPLDAVATDYLIRDRIDTDPDAMSALTESLRARGQQTPIEVVDRGPAHKTGRYGLISGWRRVLALRALQAETGAAAFGHVLALVRRPDAGSDAYIAMVEENEIRLGLSFYERARIVMRAVEAGIFPTEKKALQSLFSTASHAKRSKVKSFIPVVTALDGALRFPARIPERTGLALSKELAKELAKAPEGDAGFAARVVAALNDAEPQTAEAEARILAKILVRPPHRQAEKDSDPAQPDAWPAIVMTSRPGRVTLAGAGVDTAFLERLRIWLDRLPAGQG